MFTRLAHQAAKESAGDGEAPASPHPPHRVQAPPASVR
jgi:hypothetical protein